LETNLSLFELEFLAGTSAPAKIALRRVDWNSLPWIIASLVRTCSNIAADRYIARRVGLGGAAAELFDVERRHIKRLPVGSVIS
jgi:hypothetical protein